MQGIGGLFAEEFGVGSNSNKDNRPIGACVIEPVDEQKITADVAFAMARPVALQRMVQPLRTERCVVGDEQEHCLLELAQVVAPGPL